MLVLLLPGHRLVQCCRQTFFFEKYLSQVVQDHLCVAAMQLAVDNVELEEAEEDLKGSSQSTALRVTA
jgi:hypothetical protein